MNYTFKNRAFRWGILLCVFLFMLLFCFFLNRNVSNTKNISNLLDVVTSYAGFNYFILHGTIYNMLFSILIVFSLPNIGIQKIVRMERNTIIKWCIGVIFKEVILFTILFSFAYIIVAGFKFGWSFFLMTNFFMGVLFQWVMLILLYQVLGSCYLIIYAITLSKSQALIISVICSTILTCLTLLFKIWSPFVDIEIFNSFYLEGKGITLVRFFLKIVRELVICIVLSYIALILFKAKDILGHG
ncbi:WxPxxD family membrane protein [Sporolactobacillus shoreicorticis]|uniref:WxPxxD family membrane protein n=1 Tax=Sporolactobacillus shoreicorticis TaxID=1923877 RepID=A0ABW5RYW4_9BACL|nr:WxPxxD family membrane protein [Sporolactobacillus shoreicorticis]MCO7128261.1 WxPxxD family membrane protein [Sporolactobacillus shoreicorticis]